MQPHAAMVQLDQLDPVQCPCGMARRAFAEHPQSPATVHLTQIDRTARLHYHRKQTEVYVVLTCEEGAGIEMDGVFTPIQRYSAILIPPGVRHRGVGEMTVLIYCTPKFDPLDEYFDAPK
jgi:hypothetical protein